MNTSSAYRFTPLAFGLRLLFALILVISTYNPTSYSFFNWVRRSTAQSTLGPEHLLVGVVVLILWAIFLRATLRSLGPIGLGLAALFFGALVWFLVDFGLLNAGSYSAITWIALVCLAALLAVGMSWSHIRRRLSGQSDMDDVDD